jgi:hypothetical protein
MRTVLIFLISLGGLLVPTFADEISHPGTAGNRVGASTDSSLYPRSGADKRRQTLEEKRPKETGGNNPTHRRTGVTSGAVSGSQFHQGPRRIVSPSAGVGQRAPLPQLQSPTGAALPVNRTLNHKSTASAPPYTRPTVPAVIAPPSPFLKHRDTGGPPAPASIGGSAFPNSHNAGIINGTGFMHRP